MKSIFQDQAEFMTACEQTTGVLNLDQAELYAKLIDEEYDELASGAMQDDFVEMIDGAIDLLVVISGFLHSLGIDPQEAWDIVHKTNMAKVTPLRKREDGKILKPDDWQGPTEALQKLWDERVTLA